MSDRLPPAPTPPPSAEPPVAPVEPPRGFGLFRIFCLLSVLFQGAIFCLGGVGLWLATNPFAGQRGLDLANLAAVMFWSGLLLWLMAIPLMVAYAVAPFLPRRPWVWKFNLSLIGMGVISPVFFLAIPAGRRWAENEIRAWYGVPPPQDPD